MPTEAKRETVAELREELSRNTTLIISEYRGLSVGDSAGRSGIVGNDGLAVARGLGDAH